MSYKNVPKRRFVIDASIARAAGNIGTTHPVGANCRQFLEAIRGICHRLVWTPAIKSEWDKHQSRYATQWLASMAKLGKVDDTNQEVRDSLQATVEDSLGDDSANLGVKTQLLKDCHLLEAALVTDKRIATLDDRLRSNSCRLIEKDANIGEICWANPATDAEATTKWLESGAPDEPNRKTMANS